MQIKFSTLIVLLAYVGSNANAVPGSARPWDDSGMPSNIGRPSVSSGARAVATFQDGADHIIAQQCPSGGFTWEHIPPSDCTVTYYNITAPIMLGVLDVYPFTSDPLHLAAAVSGGLYEQTSLYGNGESRFGSFAPYFLMRLSAASGDVQYSNYAATEFFDELTAATYGPSDLNTAGWIAAVQTGRSGTLINLRPWEFSTLISTATAIGNAGQDTAFRQGLLDGLNTLDDTNYYDLLGLAGGVRGLALSGTTSFPAIVSPNFASINGITTLQGLADVLAGYQNANGSWYYASNIPGGGVPGSWDEDTQTSAYAVMALRDADPLVASNYATDVSDGRNWINSMQLVGGGFLSYPGGGENTEVEGEALSAVAVAPPAIPTVSEWGLAVLTLIGLTAGTILFARNRRVAA
jgi:hypothetical protein